MQITLNGEDRIVAAAASVADLVGSLGLAGRRVAVEHNREVVPAADWKARALAEGDVLEIVHFVGGG